MVNEEKVGLNDFGKVLERDDPIKVSLSAAMSSDPRLEDPKACQPTR